MVHKCPQTGWEKEGSEAALYPASLLMSMLTLWAKVTEFVFAYAERENVWKECLKESETPGNQKEYERKELRRENQREKRKARIVAEQKKNWWTFIY